MAGNNYSDALIDLNGAFAPVQRKAMRRAFGTIISVLQEADDTLTQSSTTLAVSPELFLDNIQTGNWLVMGSLTLSIANAAHNIKLDFNGGSITTAGGNTGIGGGNFWLANGTTIAPAIAALNTSLDGSTTNAWIRFDFSFTMNVSTAGRLQLERAQSASGASNSVIKAGSWMRAMRIQ